jgi:hypothetical protein
LQSKKAKFVTAMGEEKFAVKIVDRIPSHHIKCEKSQTTGEAQ